MRPQTHAPPSGEEDTSQNPSPCLRSPPSVSWVIARGSPSRNSHSLLFHRGALTAVAVTRIDAVQRFQHNNSVTTDHAHSQAHFLVVGSALGCLVQHNVQEDVVAAQRAHDFARAVQLHFDALVKVLFSRRDMLAIDGLV